MAGENEDIEFRDLLEDKRHKEISALLKKISSKDDSAIRDAVAGQTQKIEQLAQALKSLPAPQVSVELNPKEFIAQVKNICDDIVKSNNRVIDAIESRMLPESFSIERDFGGRTKIVKVNYKSAKTIT
jgi:seryl-tRNA synthetase